MAISASIPFQITKPPRTRPTYISYYTSHDENLILTLDVSSSILVSYLPNGEVSVSTPNRLLQLEENLDYYILMESGVAKGSEFCGPESPAIWDPHYWRVTISKFITFYHSMFLNVSSLTVYEIDKDLKFQDCYYEAIFVEGVTVHHDFYQKKWQFKVRDTFKHGSGRLRQSI